MVMGGMGSYGSLLGGRYRLLQELGRGGFGHTFLAEDTNRFNELCVLKEFLPQVNDPDSLQKAKQLFEREAGVLYQLNHPQIPRFRELLRVQAGSQGRLFLVQDYVEGPTYQALLETRLRAGDRFSEAEVLKLLHQVLPVLDYIHSIGVIHRDIAPDNLILRNSDGLPVLIDFGGVKQLATVVQQQVGAAVVPTRLGKVGYAPEEQLETGAVSPSADLYALAVTVLTLLTGESPQTLYDAYNKRWRWRDEVNLSPRLGMVLDRMLAPRVGDRYTSASAVMQALSTPNAYPDATATVRAVDPTRAVAPGRGYVPPTRAADPPMPAPPRLAAPRTSSPGRFNGCWQALLGLFLVLGTVGLVWWIAGQWEPTGTGPSDSLSGNGGEQSGGLSDAEQAQKDALRRRREALGVENRVLVGITDQLFYSRFPDRQGQPLSDRPEDAPLRAEWDSIATEVLDVVESQLSAEARQRLGTYSDANRETWRQAVNQRYVSSSALFDLADAKFAYLFPETASQPFVDLPIGQIWYGLADDAVRALQSGDRLQEIRFEPGSFSQSVRDRLNPGEGRVYLLNLSEGQLMRLNLQASEGSTRLSIYVPSPNNAVPHLLADAPDTTWSGQLPQTGYYEVVVVSTSDRPLDYALDIGVDNVTSTPNEAPADPEEKN